MKKLISVFFFVALSGCGDQSPAKNEKDEIIGTWWGGSNKQKVTVVFEAKTLTISGAETFSMPYQIIDNKIVVEADDGSMSTFGRLAVELFPNVVDDRRFRRRLRLIFLRRQTSLL